ncbi:MAG: DUF4430 domain-containing protein [Candidatus Thorarchaeota archaeon]|jgi:hypothetical protein
MTRRVSLILLLLIGVHILSPTSVLAMQNIPEQLAATGISLTIDFGNESSVSFDNLNATDALDLIQSVTVVNAVWYGDLAYVVEIAGVSSSSTEGLWWQYWVNDELATVAANKLQLNDGDVVLWKRQGSAVGGNAAPDSALQTDTSLVIGSINLTVIGLLFLGFLYVKGSRSV